MSTSDCAKGALARAWASSNNLSAKRPNRRLLGLPANTFRPNSQDPSARETGLVRDYIATTVQDQTDLAALNIEPMFLLRNQYSESIESVQVAEEETEMDLAAANRSRQVMLAVKKIQHPVRLGAKVCQEPAWRAGLVVYIEVELQVCEGGYSARRDQYGKTLRQPLLLGWDR